MIKALLVDLDGVVRHWDAANDELAERSAGLPSGAIRRAAFAADLLEPAIKGAVSDAHWRREIAVRLRSCHALENSEQIVSMWSASAGTVDHAVVDVLRACRQRVSVSLITNATTRLNADLARLSLTAEFDQIFNSAALGAIKPEAAIFHAVLRRLAVEPEEALFVDDNAGHVRAAEQLGLGGHCYRGDLEELRTALRQRGLLP